MKARLKRMSLRRKLALGYAIAMALVLATTAIIVEVSFEDELEYNIDASLRAQADAVATLVGRDGDDLPMTTVRAPRRPPGGVRPGAGARTARS